MALLVGRNVMIVEGKQKVETDDAITRDRTPVGPFSARARGIWPQRAAMAFRLCVDVPASGGSRQPRGVLLSSLVGVTMRQVTSLAKLHVMNGLAAV